MTSPLKILVCGGRRTAHMTTIAREAGITLIEVK